MRFHEAVLDVRQDLAAAQIKPVEVNLHLAVRSIASDKTPGHADCFLMHGPNEVFDSDRQLGE